VWIRGRPQELQQVFLNIVVTAIQMSATETRAKGRHWGCRFLVKSANGTNEKFTSIRNRAAAPV
jgi:nitrogen-specific signal transduction histidine kinase